MSAAFGFPGGKFHRLRPDLYAWHWSFCGQVHQHDDRVKTKAVELVDPEDLCHRCFPPTTHRPEESPDE